VSARALLGLARGLLDQAEPEMAGLWPRASAVLAGRALEASLRRLWERRQLDLRGCSMRVQLICLKSYLDDPDLAARARHTWSELRRACHHHPYELAPTATELRGWLSVIEELAERAG
jgi:hypothetical protein